MKASLELRTVVNLLRIELQKSKSVSNPEGIRLSRINWVSRTGAPGDEITLSRSGSDEQPKFLWKISPESSWLEDGTLRDLALLVESPDLLPRPLDCATPDDFRKILQRALPFRDTTAEVSTGEAVVSTGRLFGGVRVNYLGRRAFFASDFRDGMQFKVLSSILFMFFACLAPAVAFGGLIAQLTGGELGVIEMIVSTALCGVVFALSAAQPLTILGSTGPVIIFIGLLYQFCQRWGIHFLPSLAWVGVWTSVILVVLAATEASRLLKWFTRFTDEIFAALISLIFIYEAIRSTLLALRDPAVPKESGLLAVVLALGTYIVDMQLAGLRRSPYLRHGMRQAIADFGPALAIGTMAIVAHLMDPIQVPQLPVPETFQTTSGRPWLVDLWSVPWWVMAGSAVPALLVSILLFLDQNITVRLVNNRRNALKKGFGYHLDLLLVGLLVGVCSVFGLPWMGAATVRSLNQVQSLTTMKSDGDRQIVIGVVENRVSGLMIHLLIAASIAFLGYLHFVPIPVLYGLFLYMGIASMRGNQIFDRIGLWFTDPEQYPALHYLRSVPKAVVHRYTILQIGLLGLLWVLKTSSLGILFPLLTALLVPVRLFLDRFFDPADLSQLDAEEEPDLEEDASLGP